MKLESSLQDRARLLHLVPMLDTVMLLLVFVLIGGSFVLHSGIEVDVPVSGSVHQIKPNADVITISADLGSGSQVLFNGEEVSLEELDAKLEDRRTQSRQVIVRSDKQALVGPFVDIMWIAENRGYEVFISTGALDSDSGL